jgi:glycosyltransferase involved in cell wall biosynthesis
MLNAQQHEKPTAAISVAISTLNRPDALSVCLKTLLAGDVLPAEIIVVDQSKDDQTRRIVENCEAGRVAIVYIHHDGRGLGAAQNIGIRNATQPVVAVTDDDCEPACDWIAMIVASFAPPNSVDALTGRVLPAGPEVAGMYAVSSRTSTQRVDFKPDAMPWDIGSGNNFAVKREWLNRIGGNDERLGPGSPGQGAVDIDLFYRLLQAGARIRYEPDLIVYHARTTKAGRISRRIPYGYGIGAFCRIGLQQKDDRSLHVLAQWFRLRMRRLWEGIRKLHWLLVYEELLVITGTIGGFIAGRRLSMIRTARNTNVIQ